MQKKLTLSPLRAATQLRTACSEMDIWWKCFLNSQTLTALANRALFYEALLLARLRKNRCRYQITVLGTLKQHSQL
jgi:hypothetical protein